VRVIILIDFEIKLYLYKMMSKNQRFLFLSLLLMIAVAGNSCKRQTVNSIPSLLTTGYWQLGSAIRTRYVGDSQLSVDTIQCDSAQIFTFKPDYTCTYTNLNCRASTISGRWSLSDTRLYLMSDITAPATSGTGTYQPFAYSHIANLGEYSLILETGDIQLYYTATDKRTITRWGFTRVRPKTIQ